MRWLIAVIFMCALPLTATGAESVQPDKAWIERSNSFTQRLLDVQLAHTPEQGSRQGLAQFDERISNPTLADEMAERHELEAAAGDDRCGARQRDRQARSGGPRHPAQGVQPAFSTAGLRPAARSAVPQCQRSGFSGTARAARRPGGRRASPGRIGAAARVRGHRAGLPAVHRRCCSSASSNRWPSPDVIYPSRDEVETELGRNSNYVEGIATLFKKYSVQGWEAPYAKLKAQLADYDAWVRRDILPKARTDFRLPPEKYALAFEELRHRHSAGRRSPPWRTRRSAKYQAEMAPLAAQIAKAAQLSLERLSRRHRGAEEAADHRRGHPAVLREAAARDRGDHRGAATWSRLPDRPAHHPPRPPPPRPRSSRRRT